MFYYALKAVVYPMAPVFDMQVGLQPLHHATQSVTFCMHLLYPQPKHANCDRCTSRMQANDGAGALTPFCTMALKRIFLMSDQDKARPLRQCPAMSLPALTGRRPPISIAVAALPHRGHRGTLLTRAAGGRTSVLV